MHCLLLTMGYRPQPLYHGSIPGSRRGLPFPDPSRISTIPSLILCKFLTILSTIAKPFCLRISQGIGIYFLDIYNQTLQ